MTSSPPLLSQIASIPVSSSSFKGISIITGITAILVYFHLRNRKSCIVGLKQPPPYPVLGNLPGLLLNMHRLYDQLVDGAETYGPTWTLSIPNVARIKAHIMTVDPAIIEYVLKTNFGNYQKGPIFKNVMTPLLGVGIFNADGEIWHRQRKITSHIFTTKNFREVINAVFLEDIESLLKVLQSAAKSNEVVDFHDLLHAFTLDSFAKIGFGTTLNCLANPTSPLPFATAFDKVLNLLTIIMLNPFAKYRYYLNGTQTEINNYIKVIDDFAYERIRERREERKRDGDGGERKVKDLLDLFMDSKNLDGDDGEMTDKELRDMVLNMILAGRDTTAQALSWSFYQLCLNPHVIEEIRNETMAVTGGKIPTHADISSMKYTTAVFYEVLRLHPSVPVESKICKNPDTLPNGVQVPAKTTITWPIYAMGRQESLWGPTAKVFDPSRWLTVNEDGTQQLKRENVFKWPVFNAGLRTCLGQQMATMEAVMVLSAVCNRFDFHLAPGQNVTYTTSVTLRMKNGIFIQFKERVG
ncbi:hypothetical protein HDU76_000903 [Blyttiomyces sp. JEL0837]|nr:hypothetical protein HDU76_000903 [Blyttiomyces sp. JEL0837]